jgi:hypothetical protein
MTSNGHQLLSNDKLEGRRSGTNGEALASGYIISAFTKTGLKPLGDMEPSTFLKFTMGKISVIPGLPSTIRHLF